MLEYAKWLAGFSSVPAPSGFLSTTTPTAVGTAANFYLPHPLQDKQILRMSSTLSKVGRTEKDSVFVKVGPLLPLWVPCMTPITIPGWEEASLAPSCPNGTGKKMSGLWDFDWFHGNIVTSELFL